METKYYFASTGEFLGGFNDGSLYLVPSDAIQAAQPPNHGLDRLVNGVIVPYVAPVTPESFNTSLEQSFMAMLPDHIGQPYLTGTVISALGQAKLVVTEYNRLGQYALSKVVIQTITLPTEMDADRQQLLTLYPQ